MASTGLHHTQRVDRFTAVSRDRQGPKPPTGTSTCKSLWQARPLRLSHARPPDLPTGESGNGLCVFSYQFPGKCLHLQCVQVSQPPEGPRLDLSDSVKAKIPVKTQEADYLQINISPVKCMRTTINMIKTLESQFRFVTRRAQMRSCFTVKWVTESLGFCYCDLRTDGPHPSLTTVSQLVSHSCFYPYPSTV